MAWNRPKKSGEAVSSPLQKRKGFSFSFRVAIAGAVVVIGAAVSAWWLWPTGESAGETPPPRKEKPIKEIAPQIPTQKVELTEQEIWKSKNYPKNPWGTPIPKDLEYKPHWLYTTNDYARIDPGYAERHQQFLDMVAKRPWKTPADMELARLLFWKPGMPSAAIPFDKGFKDRLLKSIETPIIISKEDPPELQEKKREMIELKVELMDRLRAGEDIVETLNEEYKRMRKLTGMRQNLVRELAEIERNATSAEEVEDYVAAANKMLENAGAATIKKPLSFIRRKFELRAQMGQTKEESK